MKKTLLVLALLVGVSAANADIRLYFSETGLTPGHSLLYATTLTNYLPAFTGNGDPIPNNELLPGSYDLFLWAEFVNEPDYLQLYGLQVQIWNTTAPYDVNKSVIYRHNKAAPGAYRRWDGALPIYIGPNDNQGIMAAVTAMGIWNWPAGETVNDLVRVRGTVGNANTRALLGVVRVENAQIGQSLTVRMNPYLNCAVRLDGVTIADPPVTPATVTFIPEPASLLLLGLAGLAIRRR